MKSHIQLGNRLFEIIFLSLSGVMMYVSQIVMASLPNIELVSLLIILTARKFGVKVLYSVYIFVGCEILTYGLSLWVINYLYVWAVLAIAIILIRKIDSTAVYSLIAGIFGLMFGTICSVPYFFMGGISMCVSYIISGFWFDIAHCAGNVILTAILYKPLTKAYQKALRHFN